MAFTEEFIEPSRWTQFSFFASGGTNGAVSESLAPGKKFKLSEIRLHFSVIFSEVEYFVVRLSAAKGSAYNQTFLSQALSDVIDVLYQPDNPLPMLSDDQIVFSWSQASASNIGGLNVQGWAVYG